MLFKRITVKIKESEKMNKSFNLAREMKKAVEDESNGDTNSMWCPWSGPRRPEKETGETEDQRKNRDHPDINIVQILGRVLKTRRDSLSLKSQ